jgi:hypothetical protein
VRIDLRVEVGGDLGEGFGGDHDRRPFVLPTAGEVSRCATALCWLASS